MYVLLVYDICENRVSRVLKTTRKYLDWVQNSVFEGEITRANLEKLKSALKKIIKDEEDSVRIYKFRAKDNMKLEILGIDKKEVSDDGIL